MAQLADILQQERERDTADKWGLIHLYKTGSFYSAYEWSAWLIAVITFNDEVRMATKDRKPIAVTRIPMANSDDTFCRVGFPLKSIEKYIPTRLNYDAARHKHKMAYVQKFEANLAENLNELCDDLLTRRYKALPSKCFIVSYPKKREVFCAAFRDRIVHHLYFRYTHQLFERTFIADSYSCIEGRGTHYGISRIRQHIREASLNWQETAYAMSLDIRGYFMHINREKLLKIATDSLKKMSTHRVSRSVCCDSIATIPSGVILTPRTNWADIRDFDFILWLTEKIVMLNPMENCHIVGDLHDWDDIDHAKCMRFAEPGVALPIGNLTSQLFSNVYLNVFDQFIKRDIKRHHYGRYVDDSVQIDPDREWLLAQVPREREFLADELGLQLHMGKLHIREVRQGVEFLGAFLKPYRDYVSNKTLERMTKKIQEIDLRNEDKAVRTIDSYLGILSHTASHCITQDLLSKPLAA